MNNYTVNLRYAKALFEFAVERNQLEQVFQDVNLIAGVCEDSRQLRLMLKSPVVFGDKKLRVLDEIFKAKIDVVTKTFIDILVKKNREEHLPGIASAFIDLYRESKNIKVAVITTAHPLEESLRKELIEILETQTGSSIIIEEQVDPEIIGGLIVKIQGIKFDDSIRKKIQNLRSEFNVNVYVREF